MTDTCPRIYVACLAAYNSGYLHGAWIDADEGEEAIWVALRQMLAASPIAGAEEWAIHDYEGFGAVQIEEYASIERVAALAEFVAEDGELGAAVLEYHSADLDEAREAMSDRYLGQYDTLADYVQEVTEDSGVTIPESLRYYIDWEAMARDARLNGDLFTIEAERGGVHVFAGC